MKQFQSTDDYIELCTKGLIPQTPIDFPSVETKEPVIDFDAIIKCFNQAISMLGRYAFLNRGSM